MTAFTYISIFGDIFQLLPKIVKVYFHGNHDFSINLEGCMQFLKFNGNKLFWQYFKMTVLTYYLEIFFNFSHDIPRSTFMATIVSASISDGRIFPSLRCFPFHLFQKTVLSVQLVFQDHHCQNKQIIIFFTKFDLLCKVLRLTLLLSLYAIGEEAENMKQNVYLKHTLKVFRGFCCAFRFSKLNIQQL